MMEGGIGNNKIDGSSEKNKMFFTTSDLMKKMNAAMKDNDSSLPSDTGGFELQRKLPDGSYRPAEACEMAAADFQTKLKQAAEMTAMLTPQQKLRWAKHQRKEGNKIFASGEYKDAMDVYLTCLVAMDQSPKENENNMKAVAEEEEECKDSISTAQIEEEIKLPVLLNLALCALKLGMLSKAEKFCNYAIEMDVGKRSVKANFRRGRARMLMGHYVSAELDLARALELNDKAATTATCDLKEVQSEREAILREMKKLERLVSQAEKNEETQKKAMERVFQSNSNNDNGVPSTKNEMANDSGLYPEKDVPKKLLLDEEDESEDSHLSCFEWYVRMIGRCAQKLLDIIGEDEEVVQDEEVIPVDQELVKQFLVNAKEKDD